MRATRTFVEYAFRVGAGSASADSAAGGRGGRRTGFRRRCGFWFRRRGFFLGAVFACGLVVAFAVGFFGCFFGAFVGFFFFVAVVAARRGVVAIEPFELGRRTGLEFGAVPCDRFGHVVGPDRAGGGSAEAGVFAGGRVADPDCG